MATHADARSDAINLGIMAVEGNFGPKSRLACNALDYDGAICDLWNLSREQASNVFRIVIQHGNIPLAVLSPLHDSEPTVLSSHCTVRSHYSRLPSRHCANLVAPLGVIAGSGCLNSTRRKVVEHGPARPRTTAVFFEPMSKHRKGFPSETKVKRGLRIIHGNKELVEKIGRNDLCRIACSLDESLQSPTPNVQRTVQQRLEALIEQVEDDVGNRRRLAAARILKRERVFSRASSAWKLGLPSSRRTTSPPAWCRPAAPPRRTARDTSFRLGSQQPAVNSAANGGAALRSGSLEIQWRALKSSEKTRGNHNTHQRTWMRAPVNSNGSQFETFDEVPHRRFELRRIGLTGALADPGK